MVLQLIMAIWVLAGAQLIDDMNSVIDELSIPAQVIIMLLLTLFAPAIYATEFVEELIELIAGEGCFDDDG